MHHNIITTDVQHGPERTDGELPRIQIGNCILLAGGLQASPLVKACCRSVLDLQLEADRTVLETWLNRLSEVSNADSGGMRIAVASSSNIPEPGIPTPTNGAPRVEVYEASDGLRGPAGSARDLYKSFRMNGPVLILEASRYPDFDLAELIQAHDGNGADITVACNPDSSPAGLYMVTERAIDLVPTEGFVDIKEQWISQSLGAGLDIRIHRLRIGWSYPLRSRIECLQMLRQRWGSNRLLMASEMSFDIAQRPSVDVSVVSRAACVDAEALVIDSVLMPHCRIGKGSVVVRSLICPGAEVPAGQEVVDRVVARGSGRLPARQRKDRKDSR